MLGLLEAMVEGLEEMEIIRRRVGWTVSSQLLALVVVRQEGSVLGLREELVRVGRAAVVIGVADVQRLRQKLIIFVVISSLRKMFV